MVVQGLQHDIHGECKQASQEDVENYIEEKNKTCRQREKRVVSAVCNISEKLEYYHRKRRSNYSFNTAYSFCTVGILNM